MNKGRTEPPEPKSVLVFCAIRKMGKKFRKIHVAFPFLNVIRGINDGTRMIAGDPR
jgi:hypothetical protein